MRTLIDLDDADVEQLDELATNTKKSRAAVIRAAVAEYLAKRRRRTLAGAFGLWGDHKIDGLAHQQKLRSEW